MITTTRFEFRAIRASGAILASLMLMGLAGLSVQTASAGHLPALTPPLYRLADGNSTLDLDISKQATGFNWTVEVGTVNAKNHLTELSNWYRVGSVGPERSVHTLPIIFATLSDRNSDGHDDTLTVQYSHPQFVLEIDYAVAGGPLGSGFSGMDEEIRIFNTSPTSSLFFHFFEYVDLDLDETPDDDRVFITGPNSLEQVDAFTTSVWSFDVDKYELDYYPNTLNKLDPITDIDPSNLNGMFSAGPGNVTWALQWDFDFTGRPAIPPHTTAVITKEGHLQMIPEPSALALLVIGVMAVLGARPGAWRGNGSSQGVCTRKKLIASLSGFAAAGPLSLPITHGGVHDSLRG